MYKYRCKKKIQFVLIFWSFTELNNRYFFDMRSVRILD